MACWSLIAMLSVHTQDEAGVSEMSDWDRYASDQYEILLAEEAYEQENEYIRSFSLPPSSEEAYEQENEYISSPSPILFLVAVPAQLCYSLSSVLPQV